MTKEQTDFEQDRRELSRKEETDRRSFLRPTGQLKYKGVLIAILIFAVIYFIVNYS
jgi:hypothetical protein